MDTFIAGEQDRSERSVYRNELATVLASETFRRSPKLSRLLTYLCEKQLQGRASEVTEYSIALDVLARDAHFDPQQDAVVRVDMHHLRKRLKQYYDGDGSRNEIVILIPNGQYTLQFLKRDELVSNNPEEVPSEAPILPAGGGIASKPLKAELSMPRWIRYAVGLGLAALVVGLAVLGVSRRTTRGVEASSSSVSVREPVAAQGAPSEIRIAAGADHDYVDEAGRTWMSDRYFSGGSTFHRTGVPILRTHDPEMFRSGREGQFVYEIPLPPGIYELHLYFAETGVESEALRGVSIAINGHPVSTVDVASDAGGIDSATAKIFKDVSPSGDGLLHLMFQGAGPSFVNAIEILPGIPGKMRPIRLAARNGIFHDHAGQVWMPDSGALGGRKSTRNVPVAATPEPELYQWERFGHFSYSIPVVQGGRFTVILHFSETWFRGSNPNGGVGSRVFDVYCNGTTLLKNFDILEEGGGSGNRAVVRTFHNIPASPLGKLDLTFVPVANYAIINAIEVIEE